MLIDSHTHINDEVLRSSIDEIIDNLPTHNVESIVEVGYSVEGSEAAAELASRYDSVYAAIGVHPSENYPISQRDIESLDKLLNNPKVVAIGEIGLDYHYDNDKLIQRDNFNIMIDFARKSNLPVILHVRDAYGDIESQFYSLLADKIKANILFHCFSGSEETVKLILKKLPNSYFAYGGAVTFKNFKKFDVVRAIPEDKLLLETDCPYMTPEPHRGSPNSPIYIAHIAARIGEIRGWSVDKTASITTANAKRFFGI